LTAADFITPHATVTARFISSSSTPFPSAPSADVATGADEMLLTPLPPPLESEGTNTDDTSRDSGNDASASTSHNNNNIITPTYYLGLLSMHHIYCSVKRGYMEDTAQQLGLQGLYLYGKPGRVIVEGPEVAVKRYVRGVLRLRWQKCMCMGVLPSAEAATGRLEALSPPLAADADLERSSSHHDAPSNRRRRRDHDRVRRRGGGGGDEPTRALGSAMFGGSPPVAGNFTGRHFEAAWKSEARATGYGIHTATRVFPTHFGFCPVDSEAALQQRMQSMGAAHAYALLSRPFNAPRAERVDLASLS
jgi:hypothetical protein